MLSSMGCSYKQGQVTCAVYILMHDVFPVFLIVRRLMIRVFVLETFKLSFNV